jgi:hypothetical protein
MGREVPSLFLVGKSVGKKVLGKPLRSWEANFNIDDISGSCSGEYEGDIILGYCSMLKLTGVSEVLTASIIRAVRCDQSPQ